MQPIRIKETQCIFDAITPNLPIVSHAYVPLIVTATILCYTTTALLWNIPWKQSENVALLVCLMDLAGNDNEPGANICSKGFTFTMPFSTVVY